MELKGLPGRKRRVAARAGFITISMRLPGRRQFDSLSSEYRNPRRRPSEGGIVPRVSLTLALAAEYHGGAMDGFYTTDGINCLGYYTP